MATPVVFFPITAVKRRFWKLNRAGPHARSVDGDPLHDHNPRMGQLELQPADSAFPSDWLCRTAVQLRSLLDMAVEAVALVLMGYCIMD